MKYEEKKGKITELQDLLNSVVITDSLQSPNILDISTRLDRLIVEYYMEKTKEQGKTFCKL